MGFDMKLAVYTLTRDRIEYTRRSFASLQEKAGHPYDHYVLDNGSEDGTPEWLKDWAHEPEFKDRRHVVYMPENVGISIGSNRCLDAIMKSGKDFELLAKIDNDNLVITDNILGQLVECFEDMKPFGPKWILSPRVEGIVNQPHRARFNMLAGRRIGVTGHVGGLFQCVPAEVHKDFRYDESLPLAYGQDSSLCHWARQQGCEVGYVEGLVILHLDGTDGQAKADPRYFERKLTENCICHETVVGKVCPVHPRNTKTGEQA